MSEIRTANKYGAAALIENLEFDSVVEIHTSGGASTGTPTTDAHYAPEAFDVDPMATELDGWTLPFSGRLDRVRHSFTLSGRTGQHGYSGPWMHDSETTSEGMVQEILETAGLWVLIYATHSNDCPECSGAGLIWNHDGAGSEEIECPEIIKGNCTPDSEIEGWTWAHKSLTTDTTNTAETGN